jgi:hypothetical protein
MSSKKSFSTAPKPQTTQPSLETITAFEQGGAGHDAKPIVAAINPPVREKKVVQEPSKRISLDLPASLHKRFKTACSATDAKMTAEMLLFIERRTAELEKKAGITPI